MADRTNDPGVISTDDPAHGAVSTRDRRQEPDDRLAELYGAMRGGYAQSQATVIEETRAATQVVASIMAAKRWPRDEALSREKMLRACDQIALADQAFWAFPRAGQNLTGMTVHMARALLALWGNAAAGIQELHHDTRAQTTEMRAYATDLETNVTVDRIFTVHWRIDTQRGAKQLTADRDIYENNANLGARRFRECIFDLLPGWYKTEAGEIARRRLQNPDPNKSLAQLATEATNWLQEKGVTLRRIEARLQSPRAEWNEVDLAQLRVIMGTLHRREGTVEELFPDASVTSDEILGAAQSRSTASEPVPSGEVSPEAAPQGGAQSGAAAKRSGRPVKDQPQA